jgi:hypothetical protein
MGIRRRQDAAAILGLLKLFLFRLAGKSSPSWVATISFPASKFADLVLQGSEFLVAQELDVEYAYVTVS